MRSRESWLLAALGLLSVCLAVASALSSPCFLKHYFYAAMPFIAAFFVARLGFQAAPETTGKIAVSLLELLGFFEAARGLFQLPDVDLARDASLTVMGSFGQSGPYGGFMALVLCVAACHLWEERSVWREGRTWPLVRWTLGAASALLCLGMLGLSFSRTAWVASGVALLLWCGKRQLILPRMRPWKRYLLLGAILVVVAAGLVVLKQDSALGRVHLWRIEGLSILQHPLGGGIGNELGLYGRTQEAFFRHADAPASIIRVAGCSDFIFNEYLKLGMQGGVLALLLAVFVAVVSCGLLLKKHPPLGYGLLVLAVLGLASYPLHYNLFKFTLALLLAAATARPRPTAGKSLSIALAVLFTAASAATLPYRIRVHEARQDVGSLSFRGSDAPAGTSAQFAAYKELLGWSPAYLYEYAFALYREQRFRECLPLLEEGAVISSNPMFYNLEGLCHQRLGEYAQAEERFLTSHYTIPCRLLPLYLLMELKEESGRQDEARALAEQIASAPVNPKNEQMVQLQKEAAKRLQ